MSTERDFESLVERRLRDAIEDGEFNNLPGAGKPIDGVASYDPDWWARSFVRREQVRVRADDLRQEMRAELPRLRASADRTAAVSRLAEINDQIVRLNRELAEGDRLPPAVL